MTKILAMASQSFFRLSIAFYAEKYGIGIKEMNMEKNFELARIEFSISKLYHAINFYNGRGESGLGYFATLEEAKERIKSHKSERPSEKWP